MNIDQFIPTFATESHVDGNGFPTLPPNVTKSRLATWHEITPYKASTSVEISNALDLLSGLSRGPSSSGFIKICRSSTVGTNVIVNVVVEYAVPGVLSRAQVWTINGPIENSGGFAILTQTGHNPPNMTFRIVVEIPATPDGSPSYIKGLRTDMPIVVHNVDDIKETVQFKSISLETANSSISVQSVSAEHGQFLTANSGIDGSFDVSSSLTIRSVNGPIDATVGLRDTASGAELVAQTQNAPIKTSVSLYSDRDDNTGGQFKVSASNTNGPITIDFPTAPVKSLLTLDAKTVIGAATVTLHPTYEGTFKVSTTLAKPVVNHRPNIPDPTNQGRVRVVEKTSIWGTDGSVAWVSPGSNARGQVRGSVKVASMISGVTLNLNH